MAAVIFDLDDTLYPHVQHVHSGFAAVAAYVDRHYGVPAKDAYATLRRVRETGWRGCEFQRLCEVVRLDAAIVPDLVRRYNSHRPQLWLRHDALAVLRALRQRGWRTAILTKGDPSTQAAKIRTLGLDSLVDDVVHADEHAPGGEPAREPFLEVLRRLHVAPCDAVMVGADPVTDIEGAQAAGIRTIFLAPIGSHHHTSADAVVYVLGDVPEVAAGLLVHELPRAA